MPHEYDRAVLRERTEAELFQIESVLTKLQRAAGSNDVVTMQDDGCAHFEFNFIEVAGSRSLADTVQDLSPLLFLNAFKIIDGIVEWILAYNGQLADRFQTKAERIADMSRGLIWPRPLDAEKEFRAVIAAVFCNNFEKRNAIIHRRWGTTTAGALSFDFEIEKGEHKGERVVERIPFLTVLSFCEWVSGLTAQLLQAPQRPSILRLQSLSDEVFRLHKAHEFRVPPVKSWMVDRVTQLDSVSIDEIRDRLRSASPGYEPDFGLRVLHTAGIREYTTEETATLHGSIPLAP